MADDTFPTLSLNPSFIDGEKRAVGALKASFDVYTQRGSHSIKPSKYYFDIKYSYLPIEDFYVLRDFISPKIEVIPFNWTDTLTGETYEMVCNKFTQGVESGTVRYNVSLSMEEA